MQGQYFWSRGWRGFTPQINAACEDLFYSSHSVPLRLNRQRFYNIFKGQMSKFACGLMAFLENILRCSLLWWLSLVFSFVSLYNSCSHLQWRLVWLSMSPLSSFVQVNASINLTEYIQLPAQLWVASWRSIARPPQFYTKLLIKSVIAKTTYRKLNILIVLY